MLSAACISTDCKWIVCISQSSEDEPWQRSKPQVRIFEPGKDDEWLAFELEPAQLGPNSTSEERLRAAFTFLCISPHSVTDQDIRIVVGSATHLSVWRKATRGEVPGDDQLLRRNWKCAWSEVLCGTLTVYSHDSAGAAIPGSERVYPSEDMHSLQLHPPAIVVGGSLGSLKAYSMENGDLLGLPVAAHTDATSAICLSHSGRWMLTGSYDKTIGVWKSDAPLQWPPARGRTLHGHTDRVYSVCFSVDHAWIVSASADETVRLWVASTGAQGVVLHGHTDIVRSVCMGLERQRIYSTSSDKTVRVWTPLQLQEVPPAGTPGAPTDGDMTACKLLIYVCSPAVGPLPQAANEAVGILNESGWGGCARIYTEASPAGAQRMGGTPAALSRFLADHRPRCFHFIGHADAALGGQRTLAFTGACEDVCLIPPQEVAHIFRPHDTQLVFINGCCSEEVGTLLRDIAGVPFVVCWRTLVDDEAASIFAGHFWSAVARGASPRDAFEQAAWKLTLPAKAGQTDAGLATQVAKYELRDPAVAPMPLGWSPLPDAAGIPVLICKEGSILPRPAPLCGA